jgi:hypothetical protein
VDARGVRWRDTWARPRTHRKDASRPYWRAAASKFLGSNGSHLDTATEHYVRHGLYLAVHHVFLGLIIVSASTVAVLILTPRHFEKRRF